MSINGPQPPITDFGPTRTKQSFRDETDINKLLERSARGESLSHLQKHGAIYGDFSDIGDLLTASARLERGMEIFGELPSEVRREFQQDPRRFFEFVNDPANRERLPEVLPELAKRGSQLPVVRRSGDVGRAADEAGAVRAPSEPPTAASPEGGDEA